MARPNPASSCCSTAARRLRSRLAPRRARCATLPAPLAGENAGNGHCGAAWVGANRDAELRRQLEGLAQASDLLLVVGRVADQDGGYPLSISEVRARW